MKKLIVLVLLASVGLAADLTKLISAQALTINQSTSTNIIAQLQGATTIQVYIRASSTVQIFTLTLADGTTVEVPSNGTFTFRTAANLNATDLVATVKTATSSAVLQVVSIREVKQ